MGYIIKLVKQREKRKSFYDLKVFRGRCGLSGSSIDKIGFVKPLGSNKRVVFVDRFKLSKWLFLGARLNKRVEGLLRYIKWV